MGFAGYGDVGQQSIVHQVRGEKIFQRVVSEDWQGKNSYKWVYRGRGYDNLEAAKQALTESNKQQFSQYSTVDHSNLRNDPNWRETLLNHAIYTAGLGNLTDDDIKNMKDKFAAYKIDDIIDVEKEKLAADVYGLAGDKRTQALEGADVTLGTTISGLQPGVGASIKPTTGVGMRGSIGTTGDIKKGFETGYDAYGLTKAGIETAYEGAGLTYAGVQESAETGYESTLKSELSALFPDIFGTGGV